MRAEVDGGSVLLIPHGRLPWRALSQGHEGRTTQCLHDGAWHWFMPRCMRATIVPAGFVSLLFTTAGSVRRKLGRSFSRENKSRFSF